MHFRGLVTDMHQGINNNPAGSAVYHIITLQPLQEAVSGKNR